MSADAVTTLYLIRQHGGRVSISVEEAAKVCNIGKEHAYALAAEGRFPVFGVTSAAARRGSMEVLIPALVEWMLAGGTRQYGKPSTPTAIPRRSERARLDADLAWLDRQLAAA